MTCLLFISFNIIFILGIIKHLFFRSRFSFISLHQKRRKKNPEIIIIFTFPLCFPFTLWFGLILLVENLKQIFWKHSSPDVITQGAGLRARSCPGCVCVRSLLVCAEKQEEMPLPVQVFNFQVKLFRIYFLRSYFIT